MTSPLKRPVPSAIARPLQGVVPTAIYGMNFEKWYQTSS